MSAYKFTKNKLIKGFTLEIRNRQILLHLENNKSKPTYVFKRKYDDEFKKMS